MRSYTSSTELKRMRGEVSSKDKLLLIYVDFDDDIGQCGIDTPILGVDKAFKAAQKFAICRPTDSDVNALFATIKIANDLSAEHDIDVAVVGGDPRGGTWAFLRLAHELEEVRKRSSIDKAIVVFDSVEDEKVLAVVRNYFRLVGVETVVVEQSRSIETAYTLLAKYIKKAIEEPRYSKLFMGYPGAAILLFSILALFNLVREGLLALLLVLSVAMVVRGFNLDTYISRLSRRPAKLLLTGLIVITLLAAISFTAMDFYVHLQQGSSLSIAVASVLKNYSYLYLMASAIPVLSKVVGAIVRGSYRVLFYVALLIDIVLLYMLLQEFSYMITLTSAQRPIAMSELIRHGFASSLLIVAIIVLTVSAELAVRELSKKKRREASPTSQTFALSSDRIL